MNKKKLMTTFGSLALVGAVAVGATLAYFSDTTGPVTNTFNMTQGLDIELDESDQSGTNYKNDTTATKLRVTSNTYNNVAPGQTLYKDPQVTVVNYETPQWVFMSVKENGNVTVDQYNKGSGAWTELTSGVEGVKVFYMEVTSTTPDAHSGVDTNYVAPGKQLPKLFTNVTVIDTDDASLDLGDIKVKAATIQKEGFDTAQDAYNVTKDGATPIKTFLTTFE